MSQDCPSGWHPYLPSYFNQQASRYVDSTYFLLWGRDSTVMYQTLSSENFKKKSSTAYLFGVGPGPYLFCSCGDPTILSIYFATCQLRTNALIAKMWEPSESDCESVSLGFGSLNAAKRAKRAKHQLTRRDQWPATCFIEPGPKLQEMMESLIWPPRILWTN